MTAPARFRKEDVARAFAGARKAGYSRVRVAIDVSGNMVIDAFDEPVAAAPGRANPLDRLLGKP